MLTKINGRTRYFRHIDTITKVRPGHWDVTRNGVTYQIEGGRAAGGTARDWFVDGFGGKSIYATSIIDALNLIDNA